MASAERNSELVAHLPAEGLLLGEAHMVGVDRAAATNQTGLGGNEGEMSLVAESTRRADWQRALVNAAWLGGLVGFCGAEPCRRGSSTAGGRSRRPRASLRSRAGLSRRLALVPESPC